MSTDSLHKHVLVRCEISTPPAANSAANAIAWVSQFVGGFSANTTYGPVAFYSNVAGDRGLTAYASFNTGFVHLRTWDETMPAVLQLDACSASDITLSLINSAIAVFSPSKLDYKFIDRTMGLEITTEGSAGTATASPTGTTPAPLLALNLNPQASTSNTVNTANTVNAAPVANATTTVANTVANIASPITGTVSNVATPVASTVTGTIANTSNTATKVANTVTKIL